MLRIAFDAAVRQPYGVDAKLRDTSLTAARRDAYMKFRAKLDTMTDAAILAL
ncbi:MAG: hypothetical protein M3154_12045 [Candidatus Eremiobacteraeota bacterium]|nr:hypothetical protein [Candidatus Eremiobacteraeota bacterium]